MRSAPSLHVLHMEALVHLASLRAISLLLLCSLPDLHMANFALFVQGETQDAVYFVLSGSVVELGPSGEPVRYHREKSFFGMPAGVLQRMCLAVGMRVVSSVQS